MKPEKRLKFLKSGCFVLAAVDIIAGMTSAAMGYIPLSIIFVISALLLVVGGVANAIELDIIQTTARMKAADRLQKQKAIIRSLRP